MAENYIDKWNANGQMYDIQDAGRGLPNGVATLDLTGRVPYSQLPETAVEFKGYWNADTNTPTLADGTGTKGDMYYVDVAGTRDLGSGTQRFYVGDRVLYDGNVWKNMNPDLIDLFLPVGHLIWTGNANFNPNTQYPGTTWARIKDKFVLAAGDTYANGVTGGSATVTLISDQIPGHAHSFTPSGTVGSHTHKIGAHSHGLNSHTHSVSLEGSTGLPTSKNDLGTLITNTGGMSANSSGTLGLRSNNNSGLETQYCSRSGNITFLGTETSAAIGSTSATNKTIYKGFSIDVSHTHNMEHLHRVTVSGSTAAATGSTANSSEYDSGSTQPSFTGSAGITGYTGGGQAHNNMPPYIVKYCWERTA